MPAAAPTSQARISQHEIRDAVHQRAGRGVWSDETFHATRPVPIVVQVNGKIRGRITVPANATDDQIERASRQAVAQHITGPVRRRVHVPGKIFGFVCR